MLTVHHFVVAEKLGCTWRRHGTNQGECVWRNSQRENTADNVVLFCKLSKTKTLLSLSAVEEQKITDGTIRDIIPLRSPKYINEQSRSLVNHSQGFPCLLQSIYSTAVFCILTGVWLLLHAGWRWFSRAPWISISTRTIRSSAPWRSKAVSEMFEKYMEFSFQFKIDSMWLLLQSAWNRIIRGPRVYIRYTRASSIPQAARTRSSFFSIYLI